MSETKAAHPASAASKRSAAAWALAATCLIAIVLDGVMTLLVPASSEVSGLPLFILFLVMGAAPCGSIIFAVSLTLKLLPAISNMHARRLNLMAAACGIIGLGAWVTLLLFIGDIDPRGRHAWLWQYAILWIGLPLAAGLICSCALGMAMSALGILLPWSANRCDACDYDLTGLSSPCCPECGKLLPRSAGRCADCGYDLTGLRDSQCPECGRPFRPAPLGGPEKT